MARVSGTTQRAFRLRVIYLIIESIVPNITMLKSLSYLLFILLLNLPQLHSKLYLTKLITLSEALEINIQTKFKFTDVMITEKTSAAIQNCSL